MSEEKNEQAGAALTDSELYEKVNPIIEQLRPYLQADGGDVELIKVEDGVGYVRLVGACCGCPGATMTLKMGIEARVKEVVPEIKSFEMI